MADTHCVLSIINGVSFWSELPSSPKVNLPTIELCGKHIEKEFDTRPDLCKMVGTEIGSMPSPSRPFGAALSRNEPVCTFPHLSNAQAMSNNISVPSFVALKREKTLASAHCTVIVRSYVIVKVSMTSDCYLKAENSFPKILILEIEGAV